MGGFEKNLWLIQVLTILNNSLNSFKFGEPKFDFDRADELKASLNAAKTNRL